MNDFCTVNILVTTQDGRNATQTVMLALPSAGTPPRGYRMLCDYTTSELLEELVERESKDNDDEYDERF